MQIAVLGVMSLLKPLRKMYCLASPIAMQAPCYVLLHLLSEVISFKPHNNERGMTPISQMRKLRLGEANWTHKW